MFTFLHKRSSISYFSVQWELCPCRVESFAWPPKTHHLWNHITRSRKTHCWSVYIIVAMQIMLFIWNILHINTLHCKKQCFVCGCWGATPGRLCGVSSRWMISKWICPGLSFCRGRLLTPMQICGSSSVSFTSSSKMGRDSGRIRAMCWQRDRKVMQQCRYF